MKTSFLFLTFAMCLVSSLLSPEPSNESIIELGRPPVAPSPLFQWSAGDGGLGNVRFLRFGDGVVRRLVTRNLDPVVLEVEGFVDKFESDFLTNLVRIHGRPAGLHVGSTISFTDSRRVGNTSFVDRVTVQKALPNLMPRVAELLRLPPEVLEETEDLQIVEYGVGGHYVPHFDSEGLHRRDLSAHIGKKPLRYATILYGVREADVGGETAFPNTRERVLFSSSDIRAERALASVRACEGFSMRLQRGHALLWYNHVLEDATPVTNGLTGELGELDTSSCHMACNVRHGEKIAANHWVDIRPSNLPLVQPVFGPLDSSTDYLVYRKADSRLWGADGPQTRMLNGLEAGSVVVWLFNHHHHPKSREIVEQQHLLTQGFKMAARSIVASNPRGVRLAWVRDDEYGLSVARDFNLKAAEFPAVGVLEMGSRGSQDHRQTWRITNATTSEEYAFQIVQNFSRLTSGRFATAFAHWSQSQSRGQHETGVSTASAPSEL